MKKIVMFLLSSSFLMGSYIMSCNRAYHSYYEMVNYDKTNVHKSSPNQYFQSYDNKEGGFDNSVYLIEAENTDNAHKEIDQRIDEAFKKGSFESGGYMNDELSYGVHFVGKDGNYYNPHRAFHKKVIDSFKNGSFESSQDINSFFSDGVHFIYNKK